MAAPKNMAELPEALVSAAKAVKYPSARIIFYYVAMFGTVAVIGLAAGYVIKYRLDRRFVFHPTAP